MTIKISRTRLDFGAVGMKNYAETVSALGNVTGTTNIDYSLGSVVTATTTGNTTWNVVNPSESGKASSFTLILTNGGTAVQSWMVGTKWSNGVAPTLSISGGVDVLSFFSTDGGDTWLGTLAMTNSNNSQLVNELWGWGYNYSSGPLGINNTDDESLPVQVGSTSFWDSVSTSSVMTFAVKTDSTLWAWGYGASGRLGDGTVVAKSSPIQIGTLANWSSVSAGLQHTLARKTDGTLWAWGEASYGRLGDSSVVDKSSPVKIGTLTNWSSVSAGFSHSLAYKTDGTIWAWGLGTSGQLGDTTAVTKSSPVQIGTLTDWASISAGGTHSLAYKTDGTIWAWGLGTSGQLGGVDNKASRSSPTQIGILTDWSSVSSGQSHSLARKTDGTLWAWGYGVFGQLGDDVARVIDHPVQNSTLTDWTNAQVSSGDQHTLVRKTDGTLWVWGFNQFGQLGDSTVVAKSSPIQIGTLTDWSKVATRFSVSFGIKTDNTLWAWGRNIVGALGDGTVVSKSSPVQIGTLTDWANISSSAGVSLALKTNSTLWAWGENSYGTIGDNTTVSKSSPVQIGTLSDWANVFAGGYWSGLFPFSLATKTDGTLWSWGYGGYGCLGHNDLNSRSSPVKVGTLTNWLNADISPSRRSVCARKSDGTLWNWGMESLSGFVSSPIQIGTLTDWASVSVSSLASGSAHTLARKTDGSIWGWGYNRFGMLGDHTITTKTSPVQIGTYTDWASISTGGVHTQAVKTDGTLWSWGYRTNGAVGDSVVPGKSSPTQVGTRTSWTSISSGSSSNSTFAIR